MKQFKNPKRTKWIAALLAIVTGVVCVCSAFATCLFYELKLYTKSYDDVLVLNYAAIQDYYSTIIFNSRINGEALPEIANMEYGIIETNSDDIDVTDSKQYVYSNFSETKPSEISYQSRFRADTTYYTNSNTLLPILMGHGNTTWDHPSYEYYAAINQIVYNKGDGLLYFATQNGSIPIPKLGVSGEDVEPKSFISKVSLRDLEYFSINESYANFLANGLPPQISIPNLPDSFGDSALYPYNSVSGRCEPLDTSKYKSWDALEIEDFSFSSSWITTATTEELGDVLYAKDMYLFDEYDDAYYNLSDDEQANNKNPLPYIAYCLENNNTNVSYVISNVKEDINKNSGDLFAKAHIFLTPCYQFRYVPMALTIVCGILCIIALAYISLAIRCQKVNSALTISFWHKIPLLIYVCGLGAIIVGGIALVVYLFDCIFWGNINETLGIPSIIAALTATIIFLIILYSNLITRYHGKVLWKYTITIHIVSAVKKCWKVFIENTGLFLKGGCIYFFICLVQLALLLLTDSYWYWGAERTICIWILFIFITAPFYFYILLQLKRLQDGAKRLAEGNFNEKVNTRKMFWEFKKHGEYLNKVNDGMTIALQEQLKSERFRTELITNVSHDIKTPLTSIINYVDLLQKENITEAEHDEYLEVLDRQSARLKKLIEDLMEASKASTGNLAVNLEKCNLDILLTQTTGEFEEKFWANNLELIIKKQEQPIYIQADSRHLWRIFDNLMNNICKYAQPGTRVYINEELTADQIKIIFLNTSKYALNISGEELMERFVCGDSSRNTEGSGLGLSIARSLAELMNGTLQIIIEGDLFKVILTFPKEINQAGDN